ncbi:MAG: hypothetical protein AB1330_01070 [Bacillota bacterium]
MNDKQAAEMKEKARYYTAMLFLALNGAIHTYLGITKDVPLDDHGLVWRDYDQAFNERFIAPTMAHLENNKCGVAEVCLFALKMLEVAGQMASQIERQEGLH